MKATIITTDAAKGRFWEEATAEVSETGECMQVINLFPEIKEQQIEGFGGAFTEAAAHNYARLNAREQAAVIAGYYTPEGLNYNLGRIPIHSSDFGLGNYTYIDEGDKELATFSVERDEKEILPMIGAAIQAADDTVEFICAPWSPPAFMKDNHQMNNGGHLLPEYMESWAQYYVRFIKAYRQRGVAIRYLTVQNEPQATQTWDSCIYSAVEEGEFVVRFLAPALKRAGLDDIEIFLWDHNKEAAYQRVRDTFAVDGCREEVSGVAVHWYTGDHFGAISAVRAVYPEMKVFFTEGCVEYSRFADSGEVQKAEMYAHDILGNLAAGCSAIVDWNLLLDEKGGPNHVGNFCAAPMMCDGQGGVEKRLSYYYIGHFSRYIKRGARRIMTSSYTDKVENIAFINPDGSRVAIICNRSDHEVTATLREETKGLPLQIKPHTIMTIALPNS
ncbi:MAG: glucosylceramidase [Lachnospiraceae bacterium]|nr:glucosylceramidase [Lachnospiraceae bacterium]